MGWGERHELGWAGATELGFVPAGMGTTRSRESVGTGGTRLPSQAPELSGSPGPGIPSPFLAHSSAMEMPIPIPIPSHRLLENRALFLEMES